MFDKFGFCKWETTGCNKVHLKETCLLEECDSRKCQKRHPKPCKFFIEGGNCKYGGGCKFDHRPPKHIRSLVSRLDALEKENRNIDDLLYPKSSRLRNKTSLSVFAPFIMANLT